MISRVYFVIVLSLIVMSGFAQQMKNSSTERIRLVSADSLVSLTRGKETITILTGNVKLIQGEALITCNNAWFNDRKQTAELRNNVTIFDGKRTLKADYVFYDGIKHVETAKGNAELLMGNKKLRTPYLTYNQKDKVVSVYNTVIIEDFIEGITLKGKHGKYYGEKKYSRLWGGVDVVKTDSASGDTILIKGERAEAWEDKKQVVISDSVTIIRKNLSAVCGSAYYTEEPPSLRLYEKPVVWVENQCLKGEEILLRLKGLSFQGGVIIGSAEITVEDSLSAKDDFMSGDTIYIEAANDTIRKVDVRNQAVSIYHVTDEEGEPGVNNVSGDRIELYFDSKQKLERVLILSSPGVCTGKYTPEAVGSRKISTKAIKEIKKRKKVF